MDTAVTDHLLSTTRAVRKRLDLDRPVEREVILDCLRLAQQAPTGGNAQGWQWLVITDAEKRAGLAEIYRDASAAYFDAAAGGGAADEQTERVDASAADGQTEQVGASTADEQTERVDASTADEQTEPVQVSAADEQTEPVQVSAADEQTERVHASARYLRDILHRVPVHVIPLIKGRADRVPPEQAAGFYGGILPAAWSFQLALRSRGLGSAWTTLHLLQAERAARLLGIPENYTQVALFPVAYTIGTDFKPAKRPPVESIVHWESWG